MPSQAEDIRAPSHQDSHYRDAYDYLTAPHLAHARLYHGLVDRLKDVVDDLDARGLPLRVLEIGAGDGGFTSPLLAYGCSVTATEMSRASVASLETRFAHNDEFSAIFDEDGSLAALGDGRFSAIVYASVLHHIPDYLTAIREAVEHHLSPGGALVTFQDPLWYPSSPVHVRVASEAATIAWRLTKGHLLRGLKSRVRRYRRAYDHTKPGDVVEYHVVRDGVNQQEIVTLLEPGFETVGLVPYWSTFAPAAQVLGERLGLANTFAVYAKGYRGRAG